MIMPEVKIISEDKDIIVVIKPAGMASQEERGGAMDMVSYLKNYLVKEKKVKGAPYIAPVHRLDKPVGGVMVYAKTAQAAKSLSAQVQQRTMDKEYLAVLTGILPIKEGALTDYLAKDGRTNSSQIVSKDTKDAKRAELTYKVIRTKFENDKQYSLVRVHLITGRHHQIRVQMAGAGAGLYGDTKYNPVFQNEPGWHQLALFSDHLEFDHPRTKKRMRFDVPAGEQITAHFNI